MANMELSHDNVKEYIPPISSIGVSAAQEVELSYSKVGVLNLHGQGH